MSAYITEARKIYNGSIKAMSNKTTCPDCSTEFDVNLPVCPDCGSGRRNIFLNENMTLREDMKIKGVMPNPSGEKPLEWFLSKTKISRGTKKEAIDKITKDRSRGETKVRHEVWEEDDQGNMHKVHDHYKN